MTSVEPDSSTVEAFGVTRKPLPLEGGRGLCRVAENVVFRPVEDYEEAQWVAEFTNAIPISSSYRLAQPIHAVGDSKKYFHNGWTASSLLAGKTSSQPNFVQVLQASRAFHEEVRKLNLEKPPYLARRTDRWMEADLVTWSEKSIEEVQNVNMKILARLEPELNRLRQVMRPLPADTRSQIIHGDLTGNVLYEPGEALGIIDMTPYWRPAAYAEAIIVADGLAWHSQGRPLVEVYKIDEFRLQLLVRALYWRCLTFAIDSDLDWVERYLSMSDFKGATDIVCSLAEELEQPTQPPEDVSQYR